MSIRVQDPLFLLSAQTGLSVNELQVEAAAGNPDLEKDQEALKTGEPIPILFCRFRNGSGGVMVQPKMTEAYFSNSVVETELSTNASTSFTTPVERVQVKYLLVLSEGDMAQLQIRDLFHGTCRHGTFNQVYNGRAGTWNPGNNIYQFFDYTAAQNATYGYYEFDLSTLQAGESVEYPGANNYYYKGTSTAFSALASLPRKDYGFPTFCGTSGTYSGLTTLSFERDFDGIRQFDELKKTINVFVRNGLKVTRLVDGVTAGSDNYVDLVKYLFQSNNRLADDLIDDAALTTAAKFTDASGFFFNGQLIKSQNLLDWLQSTSVNFLLRLSNSGGKFGLLPRLPYNTDHTIKTTQVTPEFTFTEEHVIDGGFEVSYISLEDREPVCFVVHWRQQPEANFGLVRTVQVRYANEATNGPFVSIDMSNYCTTEDHAVKVGAFRLAQRKFITHHLRLTVRERSYNASLVIGDLVRVRLRRETSEGEVEYHDKLYEINRIEKTFASTIVYDLTHFPIDTQGRSIVAREVVAASGAGNTINVGRTTFDCDENSSTDTTLIGTGSGGGGTLPPAEDTELDIDQPGPEDIDSPYPDGPDNPLDPFESLDDPSDTPIQGYTGTPEAGDVLTYSPPCANAMIRWYKVNINTGEVTLIGSGVGASLTVTQAMQQEGIRIYAEGYCPDPSSPDGYGQPITSDLLDVFDEIEDCPGGSDSGGQGTFTRIFNVGTAYPATFTFVWTAYSIQDRFVISGAAELDTGFVSGSNQIVTVEKTSANPYITVTVYAPSSGTAWNYTVGCAS